MMGPSKQSVLSTAGFGNASTGQTGGLFGSTTGGGTSLFGGGSTTTNTPAGGLFGSTTPAGESDQSVMVIT